MTVEAKAEAERLMEHEDVQSALQHTATTKQVARPVAEKRDKFWFVTYLLVLLGLGAFYYLLGLRPLSFAAMLLPALQRITLGGIVIVLVLAAGKAVEVYLIGRLTQTAYRYNLLRVLRLALVLAITLIVLSVISETWYTAVVSLGVISLILGLAIQKPMASFIGWIYILVRQPYRVGDRIKIGEAKGDVIDVAYLDTTLWEFRGPYLSTDHPSGRIIKFPNSAVLDSMVYNYSWALFPYIWNEVKLQIAYESDLEFVARTMQEVVEEDIGPMMMERVQVYRELLARTPIDELEIQERPAVHFRASENTWLEAIVRYVVHPKEAGRVKTRLTKKLLARLNSDPDRVLLPRSNLR